MSIGLIIEICPFRLTSGHDMSGANSSTGKSPTSVTDINQIISFRARISTQGLYKVQEVAWGVIKIVM